ncbi:serine/threonine-protein kinase [Alkalinema sp. FACHB-956]|uniref:serine/threonine-protein kinase n=1 Tax=Alkalinema sp. FACHB-956 TaxID=2692768 RepID=UPI00168712AD|nr:serine/threonine-protein kinase [Alkalinema sp. FACHB-956]MBD2329901.1 pentapeptide repeat-containing protein [Alkalinema sp. FACHB-956]
MSYCLNPGCPNPDNLIDAEFCQACGSKLLLRDRYRVLHALGQGGFGATYLARDEVLPGQPNCVIKQLRPNASAPHIMQMARELFEREAQTLGRIGNHPQVPRLLDYFEANQEFYLVQEYVSGSTLQQEVKRNGPFTEAGVKQFLSEILPVLEYIHSHQVIHRDIKPANLIRRSHDLKLVLIDFGAVKNHEQAMVNNASENTAFTSYAIGTPGFAPPEQMAMRPVFASDIYALGVTCVYLLTGRSPKDLSYDPATGELLWRQQVHVSEHFAKVLQKMLEISVRHRYQNANEIFRALDLEPYLDSLAHSMNQVPSKGNKPGTPARSGDLTGSGGDKNAPMSPAARAALAIRARQQQLNRSDSTSLQSGATRQRVMAARATSASLKTSDSKGQASQFTGSRGKTPPKLSAEDLQSYYGKGRRDFSSHDFSTLQLPRADLSGASFNQAMFKQVNLQGATLINTDFGRANLYRANLKDANLTKAYLSNADLEEADLRGADLRGAYLLNANLRGANLCGANLTGAKMSPEQFAMAKTNWMTVKPSGKRGGGW